MVDKSELKNWMTLVSQVKMICINGKFEAAFDGVIFSTARVLVMFLIKNCRF